MIRFKVNGKYVTREEWDAMPGAGIQAGCVRHSTKTYQESDPLVSDGLGCMKDQVGEMRETIKRHNIRGVKVRPNGQLEITSRRGRRELMRVRGLHDGDGGYGDG